MSTDVFYFCSDINQALKWWGQPVVQTIEELKLLKINAVPSHWGLLDNEIIQEILIPQLNNLTIKNDLNVSLANICQITVEDFIALSARGNNKFSLFPRKREGASLKIMTMVDMFKGLTLAAQKGPTNIMPIDIRVVHDFFAKWLAGFMPLEEAEKHYRHYGSEIKNPHVIGTLLPPGITENFINEYKITMSSPVKMDSDSWLEYWKQLDDYPGLWDALLAEPEICSLVKGRPNLKMPDSHMPVNLEIIKKYISFLGLSNLKLVDKLARKGEGVYLGDIPAYRNEDVVKFLQQMAVICQYSRQHKYEMLEMIV
jgi:hypothetical protein